MKQVWISDEAYEYVRKFAFDKRKSMGQLVSEVILSNIKEGE